MRNRKTVVVAFLLVAVMLLGVGYAAVTDTLDITGSADVNSAAAFNEHIYFKDAVANETGNTASVNADNIDKASFTVNSLKEKGNEATFTFTIANSGDLSVKITPKLNAATGNTMPDFFKVTSDWDGATKDLAAGTKADPTTIPYTVTVTLLQTPSEPISGSFLIELTAVANDNVTNTNP